MMFNHPTVEVPPWSPFEDQTAGAGAGYNMLVSGVTSGGSGEYSPYMLSESALAALQRYLPSNDSAEDSADESDAPVDAYSCDEFRMYEFKVRRCARVRAHDWTECPYAHPGEKARRRDPRKYHYSGAACPDFRKGSCKRGDACEYAHGVFECWLHPARYRTQPCKDGTACRRRVCFFAHTPEQLRLLPQQQTQSSPKAADLSPAIEFYDGSRLRQQALESYMAAKNHHHHTHPFSTSPTSTLISPPVSPPSDSPPMSPSGAVAVSPLRRSSWPSSGVNDVVASLRQLQLSKAASTSTWSLPLTSGAFGSPRSAMGSPAAVGLSSGFCSLPATPGRTTTVVGGAGVWFDGLEGVYEEEEPVERVESGRALRAKMFERLSKDSIAGRAPAIAATQSPDVAWISELVM